MVGFRTIFLAGALAGAFLGRGFLFAAEWNFPTDWGNYVLTSPAPNSVRVTNDNGAGGICNSTAFGMGRKLTTILPPNMGDYTACLVYGTGKPVAQGGDGLDKLTAIYCEKYRNEIDWRLYQNIGAVFCPQGKGKHGYLASDAAGDIYLAYTDIDDPTLQNTGGYATYVVKKTGEGQWTPTSIPELVFQKHHLFFWADCYGYCLAAAYNNTTGNRLGIAATHLNDYPLGRADSCFINTKAGGSWLAAPLLNHGLEFLARERYGIGCTMAEDGTLYTCYGLYNPGYPVTADLPPPPPTEPGTGVMVIPPAVANTQVYGFPGREVGRWNLSACAPYIDYVSGGGPYWHIGYAYAADDPWGLRHYWKRVEPFTGATWTGDLKLRRDLSGRWYNFPNIATYYDSVNAFFYIIYVYASTASDETDGHVYLDVFRFDPASPGPDKDKPIFAPLTSAVGFEVAAREKADALFPQVTVDKGSDGSFDIIVAWTEANDLSAGGVDLRMPTDGDVFYRQFNLTYLGR